MSKCPVFPLPRDPQHPLDPSPEYRRLLAECPVSRVQTWNGDQAWLVTRFDDLRAVLKSADVSSQESRPGFPRYTAAAREVTAGFLPHLDPPEHTYIRRKVMPEFSVRRMNDLRPAVQRIVDGLIDEITADGRDCADLVETFALPATTLMICAMLGVPYADREIFHESVSVGFRQDTSPGQSAAATQRFVDYLDALLREKESYPTDDMLSRLGGYVGTGELSHETLLQLARILVIAGFETTASTMSLGVCALLEHPDQLADLVANPELVPGAVEEILLLRYTMTTQSGRRRVATADMTVAGQLIRTGEGVIAAQDAANRDPRAFPEPDLFDLRRKARHQTTFGFGPHACAGASLGRMELQVVFGTLFQRIPTLQLAAPITELPFKHDSQIYGLYELPVTWEPATVRTAAAAAQLNATP
jgi:cytochrome P450